ncbi:MAG: hypothetical protein KA436_08680 [Oligoflexales bacterium]|nr:hypothetical protein [Oligoflexales bacterium]
MLRFLFVFVVLCALTTLSMAFFGVEFGRDSYWNHHGFFILIFLTFFPRLTLFFSSIPFGGFFWWLGFIFCPHYLVAILATMNYWHANPLLVTFSWLVALGAESSEKYVIQRQVRRRSYSNVIDVEVV